MSTTSLSDWVRLELWNQDNLSGVRSVQELASCLERDCLYHAFGNWILVMRICATEINLLMCGNGRFFEESLLVLERLHCLHGISWCWLNNGMWMQKLRRHVLTELFPQRIAWVGRRHMSIAWHHDPRSTYMHSDIFSARISSTLWDLSTKGVNAAYRQIYTVTGMIVRCGDGILDLRSGCRYDCFCLPYWHSGHMGYSSGQRTVLSSFGSKKTSRENCWTFWNPMCPSRRCHFRSCRWGYVG